MNIEAIRDHLQSEPLYVVERSTSRRGIPSIVSFYLILEEGEPYPDSPHTITLVNIDAELVKLIGEGAKLIKVGRVLAASIHDPYLHTLEDHMEDLSLLLFNDPAKLTWRVI